MSAEPTIRPRGVLIYLLAAMFLFYEMAVQVSPSVMTHDLMRDMGVDAAGLGMLTGAYFYSYALMQIPAGLMFDRMRTRGLLTVAALLCVLGLCFFATAQSVMQAALGRFFMGFGSAFAFIGVLVVASRWFPSRYFAFLVGVAQLLAAVGAISGEVPLAYLLHHHGWRHAALILAAIAAVLALLILLIVSDPPSTNQTDTATDHQTKALSLWASLRRIIANGQSWWVALYAFAAWAPMTAFAELWGVPYLKVKYHLSDADAAWAVAMVWVGLGLSSPILGWLSDRLRRRLILLKTCAILGFLASSAVICLGSIPLWLTYILLFVFGMGVSGQILSFAVIKDINSKAVAATAIGLNNMAVVVGGAVFQPMVGWLMARHFAGVMHEGVPQYGVSDYRYALMVVPLCFLFGWLASAFFIRETFCHESETEDVACV